jgi:hypothetical protein
MRLKSGATPIDSDFLDAPYFRRDFSYFMKMLEDNSERHCAPAMGR